jgi:hypothetical protein
MPRHGEATEVIDHLLHNIGPRRATSLAEAKAAAYLDGRLRRAGLGVSIEIFRTAGQAGYTYLLLALLAALIVGLLRWMPLPSVLMAGWGLALTLNDLLFAPLPTLAPRRESQNVAGARACEKAARWRLILLAPLDAAPRRHGLYSLLGRQRNALIGRCLAFAALTLLSLLYGLGPQSSAWWYLQFVPVVYLLLSGLPWLPLAAPDSSLARGQAGALAVLPQVAEQCRNLHQVEVWFLAIGATSAGSAGVQDMLKRYPFPKPETLWIGIEQINQGQLTFASREGLFGEYAADQLLTRLMRDVDSADDTINIEPYASNTSDSLVTWLLRRRYRAVTLRSHPDLSNQIDLPPDPAAEQDVIDRSTRLILGIIRRLDDSHT